VTRPNRREAAIIAGGASAFYLFMYVVDRIVSGVVQCSALGCLPHGGL
jgi:hypothetical protein